MRAQIRTTRLDAADRLRSIVNTLIENVDPEDAVEIRSCCESLIADERVTTQAITNITLILCTLWNKWKRPSLTG
jgi:hypothetical protein